MPDRSFATITCRLTNLPSRRDILRGLAGVGLGLGIARLPDGVEAGKQRKRKKKRKKKCGKAGGKPVKGKCCKKSVRVDGRCQRCDVCPSGCAFSSVQAAIEAASAGDIIVLCPGSYREYLEIDGVRGIATPLRLIGAGDGNGASDTILQGSGVFIAENVVSLEHLRITGGHGLGGGGIYTQNGTVELIGCTVTENEALGNGGGIHNDAGTLTLRNSTVSDNEAGVRGGGVFNSGTLILIASEIRGNEATTGGGIYNNFGGTVTLASSAIVSGNTPNNCAGEAVPNCIG